VHRIGLTKKNPSMADLRKFPLHLNKIIYQFLAYYAAKRLHKRYHFDATWAMMAHSCGVPAGMFKTRFPGVPYVLTLQEGDPPEYIEQKMRVFGKRFLEAFSRADVIQSISHFLQAWAVRMGFVGKSVVIPNAVDTKKFSTPLLPEKRVLLRTELGLMPDDVVLVTTSRLVHKNAIDDVIKAMPDLPKTVKFVVFGAGPDEVKLRSLITELKLEDRVQLRGQIDHDVMPSYLKACDIFIRPSRSEGMGNSFVEAMAAELPVIATQEGGIADFLFDRHLNPGQPTTGFAVRKDSPEDIATAVREIIANPEFVSEVCLTAKALAIRDYDWNLIAKRMHDEVFAPLWAD
ncbi:MAG: glycosyltransferase family 4 protein, partial [Candidatus Pacebacteria bacterium]|nr:glycosyltransferase family 4 protein [Candidatus Paceibacterota bacterium]